VHSTLPKSTDAETGLSDAFAPAAGAAARGAEAGGSPVSKDEAALEAAGIRRGEASPIPPAQTALDVPELLLEPADRERQLAPQLLEGALGIGQELDDALA
jgi:hypothetical protein